MDNQPNTPSKNDKKIPTTSIIGAGIIIIILTSIILYLLGAADPNCHDESSSCSGWELIVVAIVGAPVAIVVLILSVNIIAMFKNKKK
ncbi:hypothetical protein IJM16_00075 [Candidatus Saccharibacteria bacterium]|nr:hypothetical protein [Candidatus Saccharibacteria bacterium]